MVARAGALRIERERERERDSTSTPTVARSRPRDGGELPAKLATLIASMLVPPAPPPRDFSAGSGREYPSCHAFPLLRSNALLKYREATQTTDRGEDAVTSVLHEQE